MSRDFKESGNATMILLIVALVVGIASTILIITVSRTTPKTSTSAAAPLLPKTSPLATPSGQTTDTAVPSTGPATVTTPSAPVIPTTPTSGITTKTTLSTDRTSLAVDFIASSFTSINTITYSISYTADVSGVATAKNIQGSFSPAGVLVTGYTTGNSPYIRKYFTLGTCSGTVCTYDTNPRSFTVTATPS